MATAVHARIAASAAALLSQPAFQRLPPRPPPLDIQPAVRPLFAPPREGLEPQLQQLGCSRESARLLVEAFEVSCHELAARCAKSYLSGAARLRGAFEVGEESACLEWQQTLSVATERQYQQTADDMRHRLLDEVRSAQARHAASPTAGFEAQEPGQFTPDVLAILHAAFHAADHVSKAERRTLAAATALSERQILTWFANQRQRRNKVGKKQQLLGHRSTPYSAAGRPRYPQQQQNYQQQYFDPHARRTVSGSSSGSASSSLVEYESAHSSARSSASSDWSPTSGTYLAQGDILVLVDERHEAVPLAAHDAAHEPHFSLPYPPHLVHHLPPPHPHYSHEAPYEVGERADVPMMHLEAPTPLEGAFPRALDAAPEPHWAHPPELEPDAHLDALWASYPSSSAGADSRRSSAASAFSFATAPGGEQAFVPPPQEQGFFLAPAPAPAPAVAALGGLSDAWMDDQFYENLFGSLGLDLGGGGLGGAAHDGAMSMGGDGAAPGLTLSMEAVRAEEQLGDGGEGAWF